MGTALGPIAQAVTGRTFSKVILLSNYDKKDADSYVSWLGTQSAAEIEKHNVKLSSPTDHGAIYEAVVMAINNVRKQYKSETLNMTYHLSPGTPAMASVWVLLSKTSHPAELVESSKEQGLKSVNLPFDIAADYIPTLKAKQDDDIAALTMGLPPEAPAFDEIVHRSKEIKKVIARARRLAVHDVSVLIHGESGTGKELFARAIHASSPRKERPFIAVNCGAIPPNLIESEFFGHKWVVSIIEN